MHWYSSCAFDVFVSEVPEEIKKMAIEKTPSAVSNVLSFGDMATSRNL
jgi:hypothetical protein